MRRSSVLLMLAVACLSAQAPAPRPDEKPASVEGEVRDTITGMPIHRAHVSLRRYINGGFDRYGALTTAEGKFTIIGIPAGSYQITLDRVGYVVPLEVTRSQLTLHPEEKKENYKLKMIPVGTITGRVLDADGAPLEGVAVRAEQAGRVERSGMTDDRGAYRIGGLKPGRYRIKAQTPQIPTPPEIRTDGTTEVNYGATYHPGAIDPKGATLVTVGAATDVSGIDIRMAKTPILRIAGKVSGLPASAKQVSVMMQQPGGGGSSGTQAKPDGSFEIWRINPGKYTLQAGYNNAGDYTRSVPVDIEVAESDIDNIELRMLPPEDVKGQVEYNDEMAKPRPPQQNQQSQGQQGMPQTAPGAPSQQQPRNQQPRRIMLRDSSNMGMMKMADVAEDGTFTIEKVMPGKYVVVMQGFPSFVKGVRVGQTASDGPELDLRAGVNGAAVTVTLSSEYAGIKGVVNDDKGPAQGARIVVRDMMNRNITNGTVIGADGTYAIKNLQPGKYKLMVMDESETNVMTSEANLDDFDDRAETVEVRPKETLQKDLKLKSLGK